MTKQSPRRIATPTSYGCIVLLGMIGADSRELLLAAAPDGVLNVTAIDEETQEPLAVRLELRDGRGRPVRLRPENAVVVGESIYFDGSVTLRLGRGQYAFLAEAGPEYITRPGKFTIDRHAEDAAEISLSRKVDMHKEGWWSGDLDVQLRQEDVPLIMKARRVDFIPLTTVVNDRGRCRTVGQSPRASAATPAASVASHLFGPWAALDDRRGGGLLAIQADHAPDVCRWKADDSSLASAVASHDAGATVVALTPFAWDFPLWVAAGKLDAVNIINRHSQLNAVIDYEGEGRPRGKTFFPDKLGNGRYGEAIYHHLLNCGLRIPPAAGSGAGAQGTKAISSPPGTNRVYVQCGETCKRESWLEGLRSGRVVVTNGPLLRTKVEGEPPGHVFQLEPGEKREFQIALDLAFYEQTQVEYLEIVQNGTAVHQIRLDELAKKAGRLPPVAFDSSGWFLVRAVTNNPNVYQFASTGPYYVESNYQPRISRASVRYFLEWLDEAAQRSANNTASLAEIETARSYWNGLLDRSTAN